MGSYTGHPDPCPTCRTWPDGGGGGAEDTHQQPKQETWPCCSAMALSCLVAGHPCSRQWDQGGAHLCLLKRVVGPGGSSKLPNVVVPTEPHRSCEACCTTVHLACGRQGSAVPLMPPGGREREASMEGTDEGDLAEPASPPRLLTVAARLEMIQISMFV